MNLTKLGYVANYSIRFLLLIGLILIWYFVYFHEAFEQFRTKAITTVVRNEDAEHLVSPTILICSNTAFKPSIAKEYQLDQTLRSLFWGSLKDSQKVKNLFKRESVPNIFHNLSYANDLTFSILSDFVLKPGTNYIEFGENVTGLIEVKMIPTVFLGTCHIIDVLETSGGDWSYWTFDISYNENLEKVDIPKSFSIYITTKEGWQGIVNAFTDTAESPILKINTFSLGIEMPLTLEINLVEHLNQFIEIDEFNSDHCKESMIKEIVYHLNTSCSIACIPVQYSALVTGSLLKFLEYSYSHWAY